MFFVWNLKDSKDISEDDKKIIFETLEKLQRDIPILQRMDWRNMKYKWCNAMEDGEKVRGAFNLLENTIYLFNPMKAYEELDEKTEAVTKKIQFPQLAAVIAHELVHYEQRSIFGPVIYSLLAFPLWREWVLEPEAYKVEDACYDLLNSRNF